MKTTLGCCLTLMCLVSVSGVMDNPHNVRKRSSDYAHQNAQTRTRFTFSHLEGALTELKKIVDEKISSIGGGIMSHAFLIELMLDDLEQSFCFDPSAYSDTCADDIYFGCSCMSAFSKQERECSQVPCRVVQYLKTNIAEILQTFRDDINTVEGFMELVVNKLYNPFLQLACRCVPGLTDATFQCIRQYDAVIIKPYKDIYQTLILMLDLDTLERIADTILAGYCVEVGGEQCHGEFGEMKMSFGRMVDNTFDEDHDDQCSSWMRIEGRFARYMHLAVTIKSGKKVVDAAKKLMNKVQCDPTCQEYMADTFYSCCVKKAYQIAQEGDLNENVEIMLKNLRFLKSMIGMDQGDMSMHSGILRQVRADFNPEEECQIQGRENFYEKVAKDCDLNP